jgi:hypothetical protein
MHTVVSPDDEHSHPKHVEIDKYTKNKYTENKLCTKLALFSRSMEFVVMLTHVSTYSIPDMHFQKLLLVF